MVAQAPSARAGRRLRVSGAAADQGARSNLTAKTTRRDVLAFSGFAYRYRNMIESFFTG